MITILGAGVLALLITLIGTKFFIVFLVHRGYGQFIRDDGPTSHRKKRGTPTMGAWWSSLRPCSPISCRT